MIQLIIYAIISVAAYRFAYSFFYERKDRYTTEGEIQVFTMAYAICWPLTLPLHALWGLATIGRPTPPSVRAAEYAAEIEQSKKNLFRFDVTLADLEHENGLEPTNPPKGWVPKDHRNRYYAVDAKFR